MSPRAEISGEQFRHVLGHLPTGVTIISAHGAEGPVGMAVNSFGSVSLDPPLVLVCPATSSTTWPTIRKAGAFCANVMAGHHEELCRQFARTDGDRFAGVAWSSLRTGPGLDEAVAWVECRIEAEHVAGDHEIVVAEVTATEARSEISPLVFFRGSYGTFSLSLSLSNPD